LLFENRAVFEIKWKNILEPDMPLMTIRRMRIACWLTEATDIHTEYVILIAFHGKNGYTKVPYVTIFIWPLLFIK